MAEVRDRDKAIAQDVLDGQKLVPPNQGNTRTRTMEDMLHILCFFCFFQDDGVEVIVASQAPLKEVRPWILVLAAPYTAIRNLNDNLIQQTLDLGAGAYKFRFI